MEGVRRDTGSDDHSFGVSPIFLHCLCKHREPVPDAGDTQQEENGGTEQVTDRDSIVRGSRFTIAWETSSDNAVYVTMTLKPELTILYIILGSGSMAGCGGATGGYGIVKINSFNISQFFPIFSCIVLSCVIQLSIL